MKVGFDYWNVISAYPNEIATIADSMLDSHHIKNEMFIISAVGKNRKGTVVDGIRQVWPGFNATQVVHEVVFKHPRESPQLKLDKCKELGIEIFFDDRQDVCDLLNDNGILCFKVPRKGTDLDTEQK